MDRRTSSAVGVSVTGAASRPVPAAPDAERLETCMWNAPDLIADEAKQLCGASPDRKIEALYP